MTIKTRYANEKIKLINSSYFEIDNSEVTDFGNGLIIARIAGIALQDISENTTFIAGYMNEDFVDMYNKVCSISVGMENSTDIVNLNCIFYGSASESYYRQFKVRVISGTITSGTYIYINTVYNLVK